MTSIASTLLVAPHWKPLLFLNCALWRMLQPLLLLYRMDILSSKDSAQVCEIYDGVGWCLIKPRESQLLEVRWEHYKGINRCLMLTPLFTLHVLDTRDVRIEPLKAWHDITKKMVFINFRLWFQFFFYDFFHALSISSIQALLHLHCTWFACIRSCTKNPSYGWP